MADDTLRVNPTPDAEPNIFDGFGIGARTGRFTRSTEMRDLPREEAYAELNDEMFRITGKRLPNPVTQDRLRVAGIRNADLGATNVQNTERLWMDQVQRLTAPTRADNAGGEPRPVDPRIQAFLGRATPEAIAARAHQLMLESADEGADFNKKFGWAGIFMSGLGDQFGSMAAGDPTAIAGFGAGIGGTPMRTVLGTFAKDAAINGLASAVGEYATATGAHEMGQPYTFKDFLTNTAIGGVVGGTLGVGGRTLHDIANGKLGVARPGGRPAPEAAPAPDVPDIAATPVESVEAVASALRATESNAHREAATAATVEAHKPAFEPDGESFRAIDEADEMVREGGGEPEPPAKVADPAPEEVASVERLADEAPTPKAGAEQPFTFRGVTRPVTFERFKPGEVGFDPQTFQYKRSTGAQGQTPALDGVKTFDPTSSGKVLVFERKDGARFVADGHQRLGLAQRAEAAGQDVALDGYLFREKDGFTPQEVRQIAAQKNLREGAGDPLDVASILREAPDLLDASMPLSGYAMRTGRALSRLTDETLGAVRNGLVTPEQGAVIARVLGDTPELQMPAVKQFMDDPPRNEAEATFIAREMLALPAHREAASQMGLFGDAPLISGARERGAILNAAQAALRQDKAAFAAADRFAADLEAAGNVLAKEENARRADAAKAMLDEIMILSTRAGPVADALRRITTEAIEKKTSAKVAGQKFADEVLAMLNERGLLALKTGAPAVAVPAHPPIPLHEALPVEARALDIGAAQDMDDAALDGAMAEAAVERAMRGEEPPEFVEDALGLTPETDLANIDRALAAMEALGEPVDPTMREAAARFLASPDQALHDAARARLAPEFSKKATKDAPRTHTAASEADVDVDAPFQPLRFKDEAKLLDELKWVTMPELAAIAREFEVSPEGSRAEVTAAILNDWRKAQPDEDPSPAPPPAPPPAEEVADLTKRAIRFAGRDDAKLRSDDAMVDLVASVRNMPNADAWLAREIEDAADDRRVAVLRQVRETLKNEPRFADVPKKPGEHGRDYQEADSAANALNEFDSHWQKFAAAVDILARESNGMPAGITEPIRAINDLLGGLEEFAQVPETTLRHVPEWRAVFHEFVKQNSAWFDENWFSGEGKEDYYDKFFDELADPSKSGASVSEALQGGTPIPHFLWEDMRGILEWAAIDDDPDLTATPDLQKRAKALLDVLPDESADGMFDPEEVMRDAQPQFAKIRRNLDELWDEWQPTLGKGADEVESETLGALRAADGFLADAMTAFDGAGEPGLRAYSRPRNVRFAEAPAGWTHVDAGPVREVLNTPESLQRVIEKRFGKKIVAALMERGKLNIVATGADLPIFKPNGKYARMSAEDAAGWIKGGSMRAVTMDDKFNMRGLKVGENPGAETVIYNVDGSNGKIKVTIGRNSTGAHIVSMTYKGGMETGPARGAAKASTGEAVEVFARTIAVLRYDMKARGGTPVYTFGGADVHLVNLYTRMLSMKGVLPDGYKAFMRLPDGLIYLLPDASDPAEFGKNMRAITKETAFARTADSVSGYHHDGRSYVAADVISSERAPAIVLHEVGVHAGMETMIGADAWNGVLEHVERMVAAGDESFVEARRRATEGLNTPAHQVNEETLAWGVTHYEQLRDGSGFKGLIDRVIASVRAWLWKQFPTLRNNINLTMADYHALAVGALRREAMAPIEQTAPSDALRASIGADQLADANRLEEIADQLKDCTP